VFFNAYMPMLLRDCQSFIKESYLLTYLLRTKPLQYYDGAPLGRLGDITECQKARRQNRKPST